MNDKIVVITGANSGIGKAAAIKFGNEGYTVVLACRNLERSKIAQQEIIEATKNPHIDLLQLDISSFKSIHQFSTLLKDKYPKLDILIHNAAYLNHGEKNYLLSQDGIELSFATNTVGPFLLTRQLVGMLEKSDDARVLHACTTNIRHFFDPKRKIEFDNLQGEIKDERPYNAYKMYGDTKMALLLMTFKMAEELKEHRISVNAVQISAIKLSKETIKKFQSGWRFAARIQNVFSAPRETMADTYFHICTSEEFKNVSGKFINDKRKVMEPSHYSAGLAQDIKQLMDPNVYPKYADDKENIEKVWNMCISLTSHPVSRV
ncbi:SDR family NAD(P)-dependent oxidoreductase [Bacillus sp. ISL-37]|jgi:NAD(P)-dependent dehydrogenase (short-subunit alcohol dehydrogenase family)|uniref:SDR family NAD(P)-dependent oxidoreductase n=1 Tax=Bacillus sp. ISL-37 TaxID=2819123 RepID=UPI001BE6DEF8|nr:SDR family NAD(P)-dependent oxidoreductase [Bacillus sp. ISL-37]MBT2684699.1 SDR family NAD(P)-dependent oxidoreductase [Bacillus sp. ISL-37]